MVLPHPQHPPLTHKAASAFRSCRPIAPAPTPATTGSPHIDRVSLPRRHPKLCKPQCMLRGTLGFCSPQLSSQDVLHNLQVGDLLSRPLYLSGSCGPLRFDDGCDLSQRGHLIMQTLCCLPLSNGFRSVGTGSCGISCETFIAGFPCELPIPELCTDTALSCLSCCHCSLKLRCQLCFAVLPHPGREIVKRLCLGATAHHAELRRSDTCAPHSRSRLQTLVFATQVSDLQHELRSRPSERRFECSSRGARIDAAAVHRRRRCVDHRWTRVCSDTAKGLHFQNRTGGSKTTRAFKLHPKWSLVISKGCRMLPYGSISFSYHHTPLLIPMHTLSPPPSCPPLEVKKHRQLHGSVGKAIWCVCAKIPSQSPKMVARPRDDHRAVLRLTAEHHSVSRARIPKRVEAQQLQTRFVAVERDDHGQHVRRELQVGGVVVPREDGLIYINMCTTSSLDRAGNEVAQVQTRRRTCGSAWTRKCNPFRKEYSLWKSICSWRKTCRTTFARPGM